MEPTMEGNNLKRTAKIRNILSCNASTLNVKPGIHGTVI